ncbi:MULTISPECIES: hypothetical protein [Streptomyces rochei group]|uniref:hypothetical protein n=1 Tax=Streptomyces rochei group TaxID=2867164 RepID=UPI001876890F|nr:hypothetical protein [Streptomyces vinaceusdrappus]GHC36920.1 hypothetical protein GCM10010308_64290 [Streptomyces vinaceusdrappus]
MTDQQAPETADQAALRERYATAIHDAMEPDLSLVDQEPAYQALIARAAEAAMELAAAGQTTAPVCICGHPNERHFEDVCQTCGCGDYLEPRDAAEVIARWRQAALQARVDRAADLREAAEATHGLSVQHVDALWDAVAVPGPDRPTYPQQHQRVCRAVREILGETAAAEPHACDNCEGVDPDTCFSNPNRPPEQCPRSEFDGYGLQCQKPAGHNLCTFEEQPAAGARQDGE